MRILVTGGLGYVGSHVCIELIESGYDIVVIDNLSNSSLESLKRIEKLVNYKIPFFEVDIRNESLLTKVFNQFHIDGVMHFAGLKAVGESAEDPLNYYDNNMNGTIVLCKVMESFDCRLMVFSSSATVYGEINDLPIKEDSPLLAVNPYGQTKLMIEKLLKDLSINSGWRIAALRYFNPIGAHKSGIIGEDPSGIPNNLIPYISMVAAGKLNELNIFGADYNTHDGTGVRDYVHVQDLARGHVKALKVIKEEENMLIVNLGTGKGYSVMEVLKVFEKVSGKNIPFKTSPRRDGDIAVSYADVSLAQKKLDWKAEFDLEQMCEDAWRWQSKNPDGYSR